MNLEAVDELIEKFPDIELLFIESGGDNLSATFSPELVEATIFVIDVAEGDKIPRKGGPGITRSDLLVINKIDLAPYVGADLGVAFISKTYIELADETAELIYEEIISCGRAACEERFLYRFYNNHLEIRCKGKLKYFDNTRYQPSEMNMEGFGMFEGYTHLMNLLLCNVSLSKGLKKIKNYLEESGICGGVTKLDENWYCIKILGNSAQELQKYKEDILNRV